MKRLLKNLFFLFFLATPTIAFSQAIDRASYDSTGIPGACSFSSNQINLRLTPDPTPQNGNSSLGQIYNFTKCGLNFTQVSKKVGKRFGATCPPASPNQPMAYVISGLPACAVIEKAFLWAEGSGNGAAQTAVITGPFGNANIPLLLVGSAADKCWGYSGSHTYRADVTSVIGGNGTYNISGLMTNPPTSGNDMDGATLFVIYSDPTANYAGTIVIHDGAVVMLGGGTTRAVNNFSACQTVNQPNAIAFCLMGDMQCNVGGQTCTMNSINAPFSPNWWNYAQVTTSLTNAQNSVNYAFYAPNDCYNVSMIGLYYKTTCTQCPLSNMILTTSNTSAVCTNCNGTATVTSVTNATAPYTYAWAPSGGTAATATGLCPGTYTVTVTGNGGCVIGIDSVVVAQTFSPLALTGNQINVICNGGCTGATTNTALGGTSPYTFVWAPIVANTTVGNVNNATALCAGSYTLTVTDLNGCIDTSIVTITQSPVITATQSQVNANCNGVCNGTATVVASGGTGIYTYAWAPSGGTAATATGLCAGTYTCTISSPVNCFITQTFIITEPPPIVAIPHQIDLDCNGQCQGSANVVASGGNGTFTYLWSPTGGTASAATGLCAGNYTCTISSPLGCSITQTFTITQPPPITVVPSQINIDCFGGCTGSAAVVASGGNGTFTYLWAPSGGTAANATGLCAGTYTCTVSSPINCIVNQIFTITQAPLIVAIPTQTNVTCFGGCTGIATVTASGGNGIYTYAWAPSGGTAATATGLCAGTYTCTISSPVNCFITQTFTITEPPQITATQSQVNVTCNGVCNGTATVVAAGGTGIYTYAWAPTGGNTATAIGLCAGTYTCTISSPNGCFITQSFIITQPPQITATQSQVNLTCNGVCAGTATVIAAGGTGNYTYAWAPSGGNAATAIGLCAGNYTCTISSPTGCFITQLFTITQPPQITATQSQVNVSCNGVCNGTATVVAAGGTGIYTYAWAPSGGTAPTAIGLCAGTYTCTISSPLGCTLTRSFTITQPSAITATTSSVGTTCGNANGSATVNPSGGVPPYSILWTPSNQTTLTAINLLAGIYTCVITDFNSCTYITTVTVTNAASPTVTLLNSTNVTCNSFCDGTATVVGSSGVPPYTYSWAPSGGTNTTATGLCIGTYTCTITDFNLCTSTTTVLITQPLALTSIQSQINLTCNSICNGSATVAVSGGTPGYTYLWSPSGGINPTATGLCAGVYSCLITDLNSCTLTQSFTISQPTLLSTSSAATNATCFGACNGQVVAIPQGGTPGYSFAWSSGCITANCSNICAGNYTVIVTDLNGCTATSTTTVTEPSAVVVTATAIDAHCNLPDGAATSVFSGGTGTLTPIWYFPMSLGPNLTNVVAGNYFVVVTDANGCDDTASVTINNIPGVTATAGNLTPVSCFGGTNGTASINVTGGTGLISYSWNCSSSTTNTATNLIAGACTVVVTDSAGCTSIVNLTITQPPLLTVTGIASPPAICVGQSITITGTALGGTPAYTYGWNPGPLVGPVQILTPAATQNYTVNVTDANLCTATATVVLFVYPNPIAAFVGDTLAGCAPLCVNFSDLSTVSSGSIVGWDWDFGDGDVSTSQNPTHCYLNAGVFTVILSVKTASGCVFTDTITNYITVDSVPIAEFSSSPQPTTELNPVIIFTDLSINANTWSWSFGDLLNAGSFLQNPTYDYGGPGCFDVVLTVTSTNGCTNSITHQICIDPDVTLYVPNAFTPNGDGDNDLFLSQSFGIDPDRFEMWIFDRWGNLIFNTTDLAKGWNGCVQGRSNECQVDVYVWKITAMDSLSRRHNIIGHVSLIR